MSLPTESTRPRDWIAPIVRLAVPLAIGQAGQMGMTLIDMFMVGKLGPQAIAGVGLGTAFYYLPALFAVGTLFGLDYFVAHAVGRKDTQDCHHWLFQGLYLAVLLCVPSILLMELVLPALMSAWFLPEVAEPAIAFLRPLAWSLPGFLAFVAIRQYMQAMGDPRPGSVVTMLGVLSNICFNTLFIFGGLGLPAFGVAGAGIATTVTRCLMAGTLALYVLHRDRRLQLGLLQASRHFAPHHVKKLFLLGSPIGIQLTVETGVFSLATSLISRFGVVSTASHTLVTNVAGFTYTLPLAICSATAILVGQTSGARRPDLARIVGWTAIALAAAVMTGMGLVLSLFGDRVAELFTTDPGVIDLSRHLILLVALFQVADGVQATGGGALRGLGSTRASMVANLLGYWAVGIPVGAYFCFEQRMGAFGFWIGLAAGIFAVALLVLRQWARLTRQDKKLY